MIISLRRKLERYLSLRRVVGLYRRRLSQRVYRECGGMVRHGAFAGMRWLDNPKWGRGEQGVMMLGLYEQEVMQNLLEAPERYQSFVDVGAADGYYAVGMVHSGRVRRSVAFEILPECQEAIRRLAAANGVADRVAVLGAAGEDFAKALRDLGLRTAETMMLVDIEGAEFRVLTEEVFGQLRDALVIVETHAHIYPSPEKEISELIQRASATHTVRSWTPGARNPWTLRELDRYAEIDRWILCSEGRMEVQQWLRFDPIEGSV